VCITAGSPYYNPHIQAAALFPPVDAYQPPEDPLVGTGAPDFRNRRAEKSRPRIDICRQRLLLRRRQFVPTKLS